MMIIFWGLLAALVCAVDLAIKRYIEQHREENQDDPVLGGRIILTKFYNPGAMLGFLKNKPWALFAATALSMAGIIAAWWWALLLPGAELLKTGLSLVLGGASSNVYDRIRWHRVTDYFRINVGIKKLARIIFNIGDMGILIGGFLVMLWTLIFDR